MAKFANIGLAGINLFMLILAAEKASVIVSKGATWVVTQMVSEHRSGRLHNGGVESI